MRRTKYLGSKRTIVVAFVLLVMALSTEVVADTPLPSHFNWVWDNPDMGNKNYISGPRNQNEVRVCTTFATMAAVEAQLLINYVRFGLLDKDLLPIEVDLSEQYYLSQYGGCDGQDLEATIERMSWDKDPDIRKGRGTIREAYQPYQGGCEGGIIPGTQPKTKFYISNYSAVKVANYKSALQWGPVIVWASFNTGDDKLNTATDPQTNYQIYDHCTGGPEDHQLVLVGWDDDRGAWLAKNSWGDGLIWVKYGTCQIHDGFGYLNVRTEGEWGDVDRDGDGVPESIDSCPGVKNFDQDFCFPYVPTFHACRGVMCKLALFDDPAADSDDDGVPDVRDNCIFVRNPLQCNNLAVESPQYSKTPKGNVCFPTYPGHYQYPKLESLGRVTTTTIDEDNDKIDDAVDKCPCLTSATKDNLDLNSNGVGDDCDDDIDGDGVPNSLDAWPYNKYLAYDCDKDGKADMYVNGADYNACYHECERLVNNQNYLPYKFYVVKSTPVFPYTFIPSCAGECSIDNCSPGHTECLESDYDNYFNPEQTDCDGDGIGDKCEQNFCVSDVRVSQPVYFSASGSAPGDFTLIHNQHEAQFNFTATGQNPDHSDKVAPETMIGVCQCDWSDETKCNQVGTGAFGTCPKGAEFQNLARGVRYYTPVHTKDVGDASAGNGCAQLPNSTRYYCDQSYSDPYVARCGDLCAMKDVKGSASPTPYTFTGWDWRANSQPYVEERSHDTSQREYHTYFDMQMVMGHSFPLFHLVDLQGKWGQLRVAYGRKGQYFPPASMKYSNSNGWTPFGWTDGVAGRAGTDPSSTTDFSKTQQDQVIDEKTGCNIDPTCKEGNVSVAIKMPLENLGISGKVMVEYNPVTQQVVGYQITSDASGIYPPAKLSHFSALTEVTSPADVVLGATTTSDRTVIFIYGGLDETHPAAPVATNDLYVAYKGDDGNWVWTKAEYANPEMAPPPGGGASIVYDRQANRLFVIQFILIDDRWKADTRAYYFSSRTWQKHEVSWSPEVGTLLNNRHFRQFSMIHDKVQNKVMAFGGLIGPVSAPVVSDLVVEFRMGDLADSVYSMSGGGPGPRYAMANYYDGYSGKAYLMGGIDAAGNRRNDLWEYDVHMHTWRLVSGDTTYFPGVSFGSLVFSKTANSFYYFGGDNGSPTPDPTIYRFNLRFLTWRPIIFYPFRDIAFGQTIQRTYVPENTNHVELSMPATTVYPGQWSRVKMLDATGGLNVNMRAIQTGVTLAKGVSASPEDYAVVLGQPQSRYEIKVVPSDTYDASLENRYTMSANMAARSRTAIGTYKFKGSLKAVDYAGKHAYAVGTRGLEVLDMNNPASPSKVSSVIWAALGEDVVVQGDYAYVANGPFGLTVVDVKDKAHPKVVGQEFLVGLSREVVLNGVVAYVASGIFGIHVVDISDPTKPKWIDTIWNKDVTTDLALYDGVLAASGLATKKVRLFDLASGSTSPIAEYQASAKISDLKVYDGRLHLLLNDGSASVLDIRTPASPVSAGTYTGTDDPFALRVSGKYAVKKDGNNVAVYEFVPL